MTHDVRASLDLGGQVVLIIGAGGLGAACAQVFDVAGATIAVADADTRRAEGAAAGVSKPASTYEMDVTDERSVSAAVDSALADHGRIDGMVNAVGITHLAPAESFATEAFDAVVDVNLRGAFLTCREVGRHMLERGRGAIVNVSSVAGSVALVNSVAYCMTKGGVDQLTRTLAVEWASRGVRVNAIAPSWIRTPILDALEGHEELLGDRMGRVPLGRLGEPHEVAFLAAFLCSPAASLITGTVVPADGGFLAQ